MTFRIPRTARIAAGMAAIGIAAALSAGGALADGPALIERTPTIAWRCAPIDPAGAPPGSQLMLYLFDVPMEVDRYSISSGLERVDGIGVIARSSARGVTGEYLFGRHRAVGRTHEITMRFSAIPMPGGPGLVDFGEDGPMAVLDRSTGELREGDHPQGSGQLSCSSAYNDFDAAAKAYHQLLTDALLTPPRAARTDTSAASAGFPPDLSR